MPTFGLKFLFLFCALLGFSTCENKIITSITANVVRSVGEDAILTCYVDNPSGYSVLWSKKSRERPLDSVALSFQTQLTLKDPRFNLTATPNSFSLHIRNIEFSDTALYECQVIVSPTVKETALVELLIRHPPKITQNIEVIPPIATLNQSAELKCVADGYPRPSISWIREYNAILPSGGNVFNGSILKITDVSKQDRGLYYCIADNGIEPADKRSVNFDVEFPPKIYVPRPRVAQALDYDIELECKVEGFPSPSVSWYKDGVHILTDSDYSITTTATVNAISTSVLRIITIEPDQYGNYECKAENRLGSAKEKLNLFESLVAVYPWQAIGRN